MNDTPVQKTIEEAYASRETWKTNPPAAIIKAVNDALQALDEGRLRIASKSDDGSWRVHQWLKQAILLSFMLRDNDVVNGFMAYDKVPLKFAHWTKGDWDKANIRVVPGAVVRQSAYLGENVVVMPSFVNVGAYVGEGTMIDTWATVGSCAQVGARCHISGGAGIGGVLEPLQAAPVIIEDECFIGARSEVAEGVVIGQGSVLSMGVFIGASTKIIDRETGEVTYGFVPPYSVVVPGTSAPKQAGGVSLAAAVIVKKVDAQTRAKTSINELLRD